MKIEKKKRNIFYAARVYEHNWNFFYYFFPENFFFRHDTFFFFFLWQFGLKLNNFFFSSLSLPFYFLAIRWCSLRCDAFIVSVFLLVPLCSFFKINPARKKQNKVFLSEWLKIYICPGWHSSKNYFFESKILFRS